MLRDKRVDDVDSEKSFLSAYDLKEWTRAVEHWKSGCKKPDHENGKVNWPKALDMSSEFSFECRVGLVKVIADCLFLCRASFAPIVGDMGYCYRAACSAAEGSHGADRANSHSERTLGQYF